MRFMVLIKADHNSEAGVMPSEQLLAEMGQFNAELVRAGVLQAGEGLHPISKGARVHFVGAALSPRQGNWSPASGSGLVPRCRRRSTGSGTAPTRCLASRTSRSGRYSTRKTLPRP
jgi:hypothetical protein